MNGYIEATRKGKIYFYGLVILFLLFSLVGQNLNAIFPITGTEIEQIIEADQRFIYLSVVNAALHTCLLALVIHIALQTNKFKQYPPPNLHVPCRTKIKLIKHPYKIWLCLGLYIFGLVMPVVVGLQTSYESHQLNLQLIEAINN